MKEYPVLFNSAMVRAIFEGSKTQTRRIIKLPHHNPLGQWERTLIGGEKGGRTADGDTVPIQDGIWHTRTGDCLMCPLGQPGDQLWVRETFAWPGEEFLIYRADSSACRLVDRWKSNPDYPQISWTPSIHMPRWASRIQLEITGIRVEQLQDISEKDAKDEGAQWSACGSPQEGSHKAGFAQIWNSTGGDWDANPWVWVIDFKVIKLKNTR